MKRSIATAALLAIAALAALPGPGAAEEEAVEAGKAVFLDLKCNLCHSVPAAGIEAKTKSEKMKGADLLKAEWDKESLVKYMKKQAAGPEGEKHKKDFKGSDEELQALVDWLLEQKAE